MSTGAETPHPEHSTLVLARQQHAGGGPVGLGDYPAASRRGVVGREQAGAFPQRALVLAPVESVRRTVPHLLLSRLSSNCRQKRLFQRFSVSPTAFPLQTTGRPTGLEPATFGATIRRHPFLGVAWGCSIGLSKPISSLVVARAAASCALGGVSSGVNTRSIRHGEPLCTLPINCDGAPALATSVSPLLHHRHSVMRDVTYGLLRITLLRGWMNKGFASKKGQW